MGFATESPEQRRKREDVPHDVLESFFFRARYPTPIYPESFLTVTVRKRFLKAIMSPIAYWGNCYDTGESPNSIPGSSHMSYSLHSSRGGLIGDYVGDYDRAYYGEYSEFRL